jgi:surface carbohydrate biosynthesis protein
VSNAQVLYLVEHVARELDIACAVQSLAQRRHGLDVDVRSIVYDLDSPQPGPPPRLVVVPFFGSRVSYGVRKVVTLFHGATVINLQFEQLVSPGNQSIKGPRDTVARAQVLQCAVGDFYVNFLKSRGAERVVRTGSLPCQLYRAPYRRFYEGQRESLAAHFGLDPHRRWIFFPENFGAAFFSKRQIRQRLKNGYRPEELLAYCQTSRDAFEQIMRWCAEAARLDAAEIIIRPRPSTASKSFEAAFREVAGAPPERLHFIKENSVRDWIVASDAVVSSFSTTILEAAVAGQPAYLLAPQPLPRSMQSEWHKEAAQITRREEFLKLVHGADLAPPQKLARWADANLLAYGDAIGNVVDLLADLVAGRRQAPAVQLPPTQRRLEKLYYSYKATSRNLRELFRLRKDKYHERDRFTQVDVAERTARWDAVLQGPGARKKSA